MNKDDEAEKCKSFAMAILHFAEEYKQQNSLDTPDLLEAFTVITSGLFASIADSMHLDGATLEQQRNSMRRLMKKMSERLIYTVERNHYNKDR